MIGPRKHAVPSSSGDVRRSSDGFHTHESARRRAVLPGDVVEVDLLTADLTDSSAQADGAGTGAGEVAP